MFSNNIFLFFMVVVTVEVTVATIGIDVSSAVSTEQFKCLRDKGYQFAIIRVGRSNRRFDSNAVQNIKNAWASRMRYVDGYIFVNAKKGEPAALISNIVNNLDEGRARIGMLWLDIEGSSEYWNDDQSKNVEFIQLMVNECQRLGINYGIYTSRMYWNKITGGTEKFATVPLWYAHYDNDASFKSFVTFGGWTRPSIKQYAGDQKECGVIIDRNYY